MNPTSTVSPKMLCTPGLSVFLHGLSAMPFVSMYHRWYENHVTRHVPAVEAQPTPMPRTRRTAVQRGDRLEAGKEAAPAGT
jgi:hypothetical protein